MFLGGYRQKLQWPETLSAEGNFFLRVNGILCAANQSRLRSFSLQPRRIKTLLLTALLGLGWTAGIAFGLRSLYKRTPGRIGAVPETSPSSSRIGRAIDSRGHAGDNAGQRAIESLNNVKSVPDQHPCFGCALADRSQQRDKARCLK